MKRIRWITTLIVLGLLFAPTTFAAPNAAPANSCAVTWQVVTVPNAGNLAAVKAISATDIWAGGDGDFLHWDGVNWSTFAKPENLTVTRISASASNDVWALAKQTGEEWGHVFHWNGSAWSIVTIPGTPYLYDIYALAANDVWLVGGAKAFHWNGTVWEDKSPPSDVEPRLFSVTALGGQVYAGLTTGYHNAPSGIYKWDGAEWNEDYYGLQGFVMHMAASATSVIGIGPMVNSARAVVLVDGVWQMSNLPDSYAAVTQLAADDTYVAGKDILHWDGTQWLFNFAPSHPLQGISAVSATDVWAVGDASTVLHGTLPCAPMGCAQQAESLKPDSYAQLQNQRVTLRWAGQLCATYYNYLVRQGSNTGPRAARGRSSKRHVITQPLDRGYPYYWRVRACNAVSCGAWSPWMRFDIKL